MPPDKRTVRMLIGGDQFVVEAVGVQPAGDGQLTNGHHIHPSDTGNAAMADAVSLNLL